MASYGVFTIDNWLIIAKPGYNATINLKTEAVDL